MCQSIEGEVGCEGAAILLNKYFPHPAACGVVGVREVYGAVKHLFELLDVTLLRIAGASDDRNACSVIDPLTLPLDEGLLDARWVSSVTLLATTALALLTLLLFGREDLLTLVNINNRRRVLFGGLKHHSHHFLPLLLVFGVLVRDDGGTDVHDQRLGLGSNSSDHEGFAGASRAVE